MLGVEFGSSQHEFLLTMVAPVPEEVLEVVDVAGPDWPKTIAAI